MKNMCLRVMTMCLTAAVLIGMLCVGSVTVSADWAIREACPTSSDTGWKYYSSPINTFPISPYNGGNCTWYAYGRAYEVFGVDSGLSGAGNAGNWYSYAQSIGLAVGSEPKAGSIICWGGSGYGHVGFVENVSGSTVTWTESNYQFDSTDVYPNFRKYSSTHPWTYCSVLGYSLLGYIYLNEASSITYSTIPTDNYYIRNHDSGQYLVVEGSTDAQTQNIGVWPFSGETGMQMEILSEGTGHRIRPLCSSSRVVNVYADTVSSGKNVNLYDNTGDSSQRWGFEHIGDGYYYIRSMNNPSCVLAQDGNNATVQAFTGANNQIWALESIDRTAPTISGVQITDTDTTGYTVTCTVSDDVGVTRVAFPTWTLSNGQDDLLWRDGTVSGSTASFFVSVENHNNETGQYATQVYAYDAAGNYSLYEVIVTVERIDTPRVTAVFEGHVYAFYDVHCSWYAAERYSESMGGHLVTINSAEEQAFVQSNMKDRWYWIGATDAGDEGNWRWITGEEWGYSNWTDAQPDNYDAWEHWGHLYMDGTWNDASPTLYQYTPGFIVEIEELTPSQTLTYGDSEYWIFDEPLTWTEAKVYCETLGGHLATLTSADEAAVLEGITAQRRYWIGATDRASEGTWEWVTGEPFVYSNWGGTDQPDNYGKGEHYLQLYGELEWNDSENYYTGASGFVCELPVTPSSLPGDVNNDGKVAIGDAMQAFYHVSGRTTLDAEQQARADVAEAFGTLSIGDAMKIFYYVSGRITTL